MLQNKKGKTHTEVLLLSLIQLVKNLIIYLKIFIQKTNNETKIL